MEYELTGKTPSDWISAHAQARPEWTALTQGERRLNYAELDDQVSRFAEALRAFGVRPGDRVATLLHNSIEFVVTFLATLRVHPHQTSLEDHPFLGRVL